MSSIGKAEKTFIKAILGGVAPIVALRLVIENLSTENEIITFILENKWIIGLVISSGSLAVYKSRKFSNYNSAFIGAGVVGGMQLLDDLLVKFMDKDLI